MSKHVKRVPMDFDWPMQQIWKGYVNPYHPVECRACKGRGYSQEYRRLEDRWYGFDRQGEPWCHHVDADDIAALIAADRLWDFTRRPLNAEQARDIEEGDYWLPYYNGYVPSPEEVNAWSRQGFGHDGLNAGYVIEAKCKRLGYPLLCPHCEGRGHFWQTPEIEAASDAWEDFDPPTGDGYQLWEDTTEGSPVSPVFTSLDELCAWAAENAHTFAHYSATAAEWKAMLEDGHVYHQDGNNIFL